MAMTSEPYLPIWRVNISWKFNVIHVSICSWYIYMPSNEVCETGIALFRDADPHQQTLYIKDTPDLLLPPFIARDSTQ